MPSAAISDTSMATTSAPSTASSKRNSVVARSKRAHREVRFGSYVLGSTLGEGEFGKVKLGWRKDGKAPSQAAIKLIRRESIPRGSERESKVHREINSLKRLAHPNIVRLEEVLQNDKYIGIVLEYASGGELFDYILEHRYLKDSMACKLFAQLVSGVDYMHSKGIVHRDLKLENLLLDKHKNIIISDFGFVNSFRYDNELMKTSCGSPCYAAPELVVSSEPYEARKVDVWSCGVILYAMLAGYLPFDDDPQNPDGDNIARLYHYITHTPLTFPEYVQPMPRDLLRKIIVSNPKNRITLKEARAHAWLSPHAPFLSVTPTEWDRSYRSARSRLHSNIDSENRRHSLMEGKINSASSAQGFLMNPQHARSYSTQNVSQKLYSHPAAPQTSASHAIGTLPVSATSHEISASSRSSTPGFGKSQLSSPQSPIFEQPAQSAGQHQRGGSISNASMALQAVVQADVVERRNSVSSAESSTHQQPHFVKPDIHRASTHTGEIHDRKPFASESVNSSLSNIEESVPAVTTTATGVAESKTSMLPPSAPKSAGSTATTASTRLPGPHVKPRPTSYHPGSYSSGGNSDYYSLLPFNLTSSSSHVSKVSPKSSSQDTVKTPTTAQREKRNSWSKISEPFVDMSSASGMLSTSDRSEKRKSIALDSLSNAIETLNSRDTKDDTPSEKSVERESIAKTEATQEMTPATTVAAVEPVPAVPSEVKETTPAVEQLAPVQEDKASTQPKVAAPPQVVGSRKANNHDSANENKENKPAATAPRSKRFSFFYTSTTSDHSSSNNTSKIVDYRHPSTTTTASTSSSSSGGRKVLEPSNATNIMKAKRDEATRKQNRMSTIGPSSGPKESSAAKKVVDFFKRRSMRV